MIHRVASIVYYAPAFPLIGLHGSIDSPVASNAFSAYEIR